MFKYRCPRGLELEVVEDYGPVVHNVDAFRQETGYALHPECVKCKDHSSPRTSATWKGGHFYPLKYCDHEKIVAGMERG